MPFRLSETLMAAMEGGNPVIHLLHLDELRPSFFMFICSNCNCDICEKISLQGYWSPVETLIFQTILDHSDGCQDGRALVVDVGAHVGYFSLLSAAYGCRVASFEPNGLALKYLEASKDFNNFGNISIHPEGVGEDVTEAVYTETDTWALNNFGATKRRQLAEVSSTDTTLRRVSDRSSGMRFASTNNQTMEVAKSVRRKSNVQSDDDTAPAKDHHSQFRGRRMLGTVRVTQLDRVVNESVLLLKIDTEGYETKVIAGAKALLSQHRVANVLVEVKQANTQRKRDFLWNLANAGGFLHVYNWLEIEAKLDGPIHLFDLQNASLVDVSRIVRSRDYYSDFQFQDFWFSRAPLPWI